MTDATALRMFMLHQMKLPLREPTIVELQNESGQLIERASNLQAHKNERCHHQIETEMHENLEPIFSGGRAVLHGAGNQTQYSSMITRLNFEPCSICRQ
jgi:hypothetical protein